MSQACAFKDKNHLCFCPDFGDNILVEFGQPGGGSKEVVAHTELQTEILNFNFRILHVVARPSSLPPSLAPLCCVS